MSNQNEQCPVCGNPPVGNATINGARYCNPGTAATRGTMTCWEQARADRDTRANG